MSDNACSVLSFHRITPYGPSWQTRLMWRPRDLRVGLRYGRQSGRMHLWLHIPLLALNISW